jgi:hypothetical protein
MSEAGRIRFLAIGILAAFLLLAGALLSIPLLIRDPLPVVRPNAQIAFPAEPQGERVAARLHVNAGGEFALLVSLAEADELAPPPRVVLAMPTHEMPPIEPELEVLRAGVYRATGQLGMPGRWALRILTEAEPQVFEFILAEF